MAEPIECNLPFERLPCCACDPGSGDPPTKLQMLECKMRGGPCAGCHDGETQIPAEPKVT